MKIINKARGTGKTWNLIKEASMDRTSGILVYNNHERYNIEFKISEMHCFGEITYRPKVYTVEDLNTLKGRDEIVWYVDELDHFIRKSLGISVHTATMTGEVEDSTKNNCVGELQFKLKLDTSEFEKQLRGLRRFTGAIEDYIGDKSSFLMPNPKVLIFTHDSNKAKSVIDYYVNTYKCTNITVIGKNTMYVNLEDGRRVQWVKPTDTVRGHKCSEAYVDRDIDKQTLDNIIMPCCIYCTKETIRMI